MVEIVFQDHRLPNLAEESRHEDMFEYHSDYTHHPA